MTGSEYRKVREQIGTQEFVAGLLGVATSTIHRREVEIVGVSPEAEMALRDILRKKKKARKRRKR